MSSNIQSKILICDLYLFRNFAVGIWRREKPQHESAKVSEDQEESEAEEQDEEARKTDTVKIYCERHTSRLHSVVYGSKLMTNAPIHPVFLDTCDQQLLVQTDPYSFSFDNWNAIEKSRTFCQVGDTTVSYLTYDLCHCQEASEAEDPAFCHRIPLMAVFTFQNGA